MSGEDFNKASVTYCTDLQEIADILMKRHDCHTNTGYSISNVSLWLFPGRLHYLLLDRYF